MTQTNMYLKLKDISTFTITGFSKKYFGRWNEAEKKYERSDNWTQGFRPMWSFTVNNGESLDLSQDQLSQVLVACFDANCDIFQTFTVKTNGKQGMDIRYYINLAPRMTQNTNSGSPYQKATENASGDLIGGNNANLEVTQDDINQIPF